MVIDRVSGAVLEERSAAQALGGAPHAALVSGARVHDEGFEAAIRLARTISAFKTEAAEGHSWDGHGPTPLERTAFRRSRDSREQAARAPW